MPIHRHTVLSVSNGLEPLRVRHVSRFGMHYAERARTAVRPGDLTIADR
jgi:hypothetical protein